MMDLAALKKEARSKKTSVTRLEILARHRDTGVQLAVAKNPSTTAATLEYLSRHGRFNILKAVAGNQNTPDDILLKLACHKQDTVRQAVLNRQWLSPQLVDVLFQDPNPMVRQSLVRKLGYSASLTQNIIKRLLYDESPLVRICLVRADVFEGNPEALEHYVRDPDNSIREALAMLPKIKELARRPDLIELLINDPQPTVRIAGYKYGDKSVWIKLLTDNNAIVRAGVLEFLAECPKELSDQYLTGDFFVSLAKAHELSVRQALTNHINNLPEAALEAMANDTEPEIRLSLFRRYRLPMQVLKSYATDTEATIRCGVAKSICFYSSVHGGNSANDPLVLEILQQLSKDTDSQQFVWGLTENTIAEIAQNRLEHVRSKLGGTA